MCVSFSEVFVILRVCVVVLSKRWGDPKGSFALLCSGWVFLFDWFRNFLSAVLFLYAGDACLARYWGDVCCALGCLVGVMLVACSLVTGGPCQ